MNPISHIHLGTVDLSRALAFYDAVLPELGWRSRFVDQAAGWAGWEPAAGGRPLLLIGRAFDGQPASPGNGVMLALHAATRTAVDQAHASALASGGTCEGPPGLRPHYHPDYYGAYFRDPDGNKLCVCCHLPAV